MTGDKEKIKDDALCGKLYMWQIKDGCTNIYPIWIDSLECDVDVLLPRGGIDVSSSVDLD